MTAIKKSLALGIVLALIVLVYFNPSKYFWNKHGSCGVEFFRKFVPSDYPLEVYEVITMDGFKLQVFRLQKSGTSIRSGLPPVLVQHGMDNSALIWVINQETSLALMLADQGFDVWLGNNRGNRFAREHLEYTQEAEEFWEWSFQEMAQFDLPATIKKMRTVTGIDRFTYIGYSQGASQMLAAMSDPEIQHTVLPYVDTFHAIAPAVYLTNTEVLSFRLAKWFYWFLYPGRLFIGLRHLELGDCDYDPQSIDIHRKSCTGSSTSCNHFWFTDLHRETVNYENYGHFALANPSGMSMHSVQHYAQFITQPKDGRTFQKYDYGTDINLAKYNQSSPPVYALDQIKARIRLYIGQGDLLTHIDDSSLIAENLKSADVKVRVFEKWGHLSFVLPKPEEGREFYQFIINDIKDRLQ